MGQTYLADDYIQLTPVTTVATYNSLPAANSVTPYTDRVLVKDTGLEFFSDGTAWISISGKSAQPNLTTGTLNFGDGYQALSSVTTGTDNQAVGYQALKALTTGIRNVAVGKFALGGANGNYCVGIGTSAAGYAGSDTTAIGYVAASSTSQTGITAIGSGSLQQSDTGTGLVAVGYQAGQLNRISTNLTAIGYQSLQNNGKQVTAGSFVSGTSYKIASVGTTDFTLIGSANNTVGTVFTATGVGTGTGTANISGANANTAIGYLSLNANLSYANCTGLGANTAVTGANQVQLGDSATTTYAYGAVQNRSDERDKADIRPCQLGLEFVNKIDFVDFKWDKREDYKPEMPVKPDYPAQESLTDEKYEAVKAEVDAEFELVLNAWLESVKLENITHDGTHKGTRYHHGVIAQQLKAVLDELGTDFGGYQYHKLKGGDDVMSVGYEEFIAPFGKAIQQLAADIALIKSKLGL